MWVPRVTVMAPTWLPSVDTSPFGRSEIGHITTSESGGKAAWVLR